MIIVFMKYNIFIGLFFIIIKNKKSFVVNNFLNPLLVILIAIGK